MSTEKSPSYTFNFWTLTDKVFLMVVFFMTLLTTNTSTGNCSSLCWQSRKLYEIEENSHIQNCKAASNQYGKTHAYMNEKKRTRTPESLILLIKETLAALPYAFTTTFTSAIKLGFKTFKRYVYIVSYIIVKQYLESNTHLAYMNENRTLELFLCWWIWHLNIVKYTRKHRRLSGVFHKPSSSIVIKRVCMVFTCKELFLKRGCND